jgi:hypothetical protein
MEKQKKLLGFDCYKKIIDGSEWYDIFDVLSLTELKQMIKEEVIRSLKK